MSRKLSWHLVLALVMVSMLLTACGGSKPAPAPAPSASPSPAAPAPAPAPAPKPPVKLSVVYPSSAGIGDVASLLAWDLLKTRGYEVDAKFLAKSELAAQAVTSGEAQIGAVPAATGMQAVLAGSDMKIFLEHKRNEWTLETTVDVKDAKQLVGKRVAMHSNTGQTTALLTWTEKQYGITLNKQIVPGSDVRAQALLNGQIDASPLELQDSIAVEKKAPGKFHGLIYYSKLFPQLAGTAFWAKPDFIAKNPQVIADIIKANLEVRRKAQKDPNWLIEEAKKKLPAMDPKDVEIIAKAYIDNQVWDTNGNLTAEGAKFSVNFYSDAGMLKGENIKPEGFFNTAPLEAVLKEIGKA